MDNISPKNSDHTNLTPSASDPLFPASDFNFSELGKAYTACKGGMTKNKVSVIWPNNGHEDSKHTL